MIEEFSSLYKGDWVELLEAGEPTKAQITEVSFGYGKPYITAETTKSIYTMYGRWYIPGVRRIKK